MPSEPACEAGEDPGGSMRCPTCGAQQAWSDVCRRCRCDLGLLRETVAAARAARRRCLRALRAGRFDQACRHARDCYELCADKSAARLLAVCEAARSDWPAALEAVRRLHTS